MRFENVEFYEIVEVGKDVLGNPIEEEQLIGKYPAKLTQWTVEEIALLERDITQTFRKMLTTAPIDVLKRATHVYIDDKKYGNIDVKSDFTRWRLCHIKEYYT